MKKILAVALATTLLPVALVGCGKDTAPNVERRQTPAPTVTETPSDEHDRPATPDKMHGVEIIIGGSHSHNDKSREQKPNPGARRLYDFDKSYIVEYIHTPFGIDKDETLDYKLDLSHDNTYTLEVTADGITATHSGKWYRKHDTLMLFYDEQIDQPAHNVYVADSLYCEIMPHGKLMIYDRCYTIVLAETKSEETPVEQPFRASQPQTERLSR